MSYLLLECFIVGLYCAILALFIGKHPFLLGIIKHGVPGLLGIHTWYCNYHCNGFVHSSLFMECLLEGFVFYVCCSFVGKSILSYFFIGCFLHLSA